MFSTVSTNISSNNNNLSLCQAGILFCKSPLINSLKAFQMTYLSRGVNCFSYSTYFCFVLQKKDEDDEAKVEEEKEEEKPKTKKVSKTTWDWELMNSSKPIWTKKPKEVTDDEYNEFYKAMAKVSVQKTVFSSHFMKLLVYLKTYNPKLLVALIDH